MMRNFQHNKSFQHLAYSKPVLLLLTILLLFFIWGMFGFINKMIVTMNNRELVENKVIELKAEKIKLSAEIAKLQTEKGVEESIRDKFGLAKEGENMIIVVEDKNTPVVENESSSRFFGFFKNFFK